MATVFGQARSDELDAVASAVRRANALDGQLLAKRTAADIQNCMYLIGNRNEAMLGAAIEARQQCGDFADMLRRRQLPSSDASDMLENLRMRALFAIAVLQKSILEAEPSVEARHLGLS